jgi:uncharacterized protein YcfJ
MDDEPPPQEPCQSPTPSQQSQQEKAAAAQQQQPQSARARIAKLTATIIGAVGSGVSGANNSGGGEQIPETLEGWTQRELEENFIGLKIREADTLAELKEMRQKVMELETQNHVCTNQLKRQDDEIKRLREDKEICTQVTRKLFIP